MKTVRFLLAFASLLFSHLAFAQEDGFLWSVDNAIVFDNREGSQAHAPQGTIFLNRFSPEIGVRFLGNHELKGGTSYIQPIGIGYKRTKFVPTFYYTYNQPVKRQWSVSVGMIPRHKLRHPLPEILWSDSMAYFNPNIRGVLLQCVKDSLLAEIILDWRSLQSETQREAFNINANVEGRLGRTFLLGGHAQLNHLAKQENAPAGQGVNDDMFLNPYIGWNLKQGTALDSLQLKLGGSFMFDRCRAIGEWDNAFGLLVDAVAQYKKIGIKETLYVGQPSLPLLEMYGSLLNMGDPHFHSKFYSHTRIYSPIVENQFVNFAVALDFNITAEGTSCYQKILLRVNIDSDGWKHRGSDKKILNVY